MNDADAIYLYTDASNYGVGAYLFQLTDSKECPAAILSKLLSDEQSRWSVPESLSGIAVLMNACEMSNDQESRSRRALSPRHIISLSEGHATVLNLLLAAITDKTSFRLKPIALCIRLVQQEHVTAKNIFSFLIGEVSLTYRVAELSIQEGLNYFLRSTDVSLRKKFVGTFVHFFR
jgi:hypothetical protein